MYLRGIWHSGNLRKAYVHLIQPAQYDQTVITRSEGKEATGVTEPPQYPRQRYQGINTYETKGNACTKQVS